MKFKNVQDKGHPNLPQVLHILDRLTDSKSDDRINLKTNFNFSTYIIKGQLISKCPFDVFKSPPKPMIFCKDFCPSGKAWDILTFLLCLVHVIWTEGWMLKLVLNVKYLLLLSFSTADEFYNLGHI